MTLHPGSGVAMIQGLGRGRQRAGDVVFCRFFDLFTFMADVYSAGHAEGRAPACLSSFQEDSSLPVMKTEN